MEKQKEPSNIPQDEESKKLLCNGKESPLPKELDPILQNLSKQQKQKIIQAFKSVSIQRTFSGPIPHPDVLKGYNDVVKDGAERIIAMAEKQSNHRMILEDHALREGVKQSSRGQVFALLIGLTAIITGGYVALNNQPGAGGTIAGLGITGLAAVFLTGRAPKQ